MRLLSALFGLLFFFSASAQKSANTKISGSKIFAEIISADRIQRHLMVIASDGMMGREAGEPGIKKAAKYIKQKLQRYGVKPFGKNGQYEQPFAFHKERWHKKSLLVKNHKLDFGHDFYASVSTNASLDTFSANEVIFLGYGIESDTYNDYKGTNVRDKVVIVFAGEPFGKNGQSFITKSTTPSEWSSNDLLKFQAAYRHGVKAIFIILDDLSQMSEEQSIGWSFGEGLKPQNSLANNMYVSTDAVMKMLGKKYKKMRRCQSKIIKKGKPYNLTVKTNIAGRLAINREVLIDDNLLAIVEGSDQKLKNEFVFMTVHLDHLGQKGTDIYNGADDNGSGSSSLLEVASAFVAAKRAKVGPKRSVVFMWVSGEEKGLLGSRYFVENPLVPLDSIVAEINMDMIGRVDEKHQQSPDYVYVIGANRLSTTLDTIIANANEEYTKLDLDYTYNAKDDPNRYYYRSDHYSFAKKGIPSVFFFKGVHEDYHRPTDTFEKIKFKKVSVVAQLAFYTVWEIANRPERLKVNVPPK